MSKIVKIFRLPTDQPTDLLLEAPTWSLENYRAKQNSFSATYTDRILVSRLIQLLSFIFIVRFCSNSWTWEGYISGFGNFVI